MAKKPECPCPIDGSQMQRFNGVNDSHKPGYACKVCGIEIEEAYLNDPKKVAALIFRTVGTFEWRIETYEKQNKILAHQLPEELIKRYDGMSAEKLMEEFRNLREPFESDDEKCSLAKHLDYLLNQKGIVYIKKNILEPWSKSKNSAE